MAKVVNPTKVITGPETRWSYANVWEPKAINGGTPKFSVSLIIKKNDPCVEKIKAAIQAAYEEGQVKLKGTGKSVPPLVAIKTPLRDGDAERPDDPAYHFDIVVNLAAQAGVRYSIDHPDVYIESNIIGFYNLLEACRHNPVEHLVYASSSSVYGGNKKVPFSTEDISTLQEELVRAKVLPEDYDFEGHRELVGMQAGDVPVTYADSEALERDYGFTPKIGIREGLRAFAEWYAEYYK